MTSSTPIYYYFPYESLTPVTGRPTFKTIQNSLRETLANLSSVPTPCGHHLGHTALGVSEARFKRISKVPYIRPEKPAPFKPTDAKDKSKTENEKRDYEELLDYYNAINLLERTCLRKLQLAYERDFIKGLTARDTGLLNCSIPEFFDYMFLFYGNATPVGVAEARRKALFHQYNPDMPMECVFDVIEDYSDLLEIATGTPEIEATLIDMIIIILTNARIFTKAIHEWHALEAEQRTWAKCEEHFCAAHLRYKKARLPEQYHLAVSTTTTHANQVSSPIQPSKDAMILRLVEELKRLKAILDNQQDTSKKQKGQRKYCFTHGCCAHSGADCKNPVQGHKKEATFTNMMGGSTKNCFWLA